ncbi:hypothetical protein HN51_014396 [Arachis hypogaea]
MESSANNHLKPKEEDSLSLAMEMLGMNVVPLAVKAPCSLQRKLRLRLGAKTQKHLKCWIAFLGCWQVTLSFVALFPNKIIVTPRPTLALLLDNVFYQSWSHFSLC